MTPEQRAEIATILETVASDGLPGPRDLDVALDAIESAMAIALSRDIVIDVWGGENSGEHVARRFGNWAYAKNIAKRELAAGFLVNLRATSAWGPSDEFDLRTKH